MARGILTCQQNEKTDLQFNRGSIVGSQLTCFRTTETSTTAISALQANAPQTLTSPVETALYTTPTLTFGEVGEIGYQSTSGYSSDIHGPGQFDKTALLERMTFLHSLSWSKSDRGLLHQMDLLSMLKNVPRNKVVFDQFHYFRADVELTVKMNSNQFYYGALMLTMWPSQGSGAGQVTGNTPYERAVLDPTIISASSAQSVVKSWTYSFPNSWMFSDFATDEVLNVCLDALTPLETASDTMPDSITLQFWARFKNVKLAYPTGPSTEHFQAQSRSFPSVKRSRTLGDRHPAESSSGPISEAMSSIASLDLEGAFSDARSLASFVTDNWALFGSAMAFVLDKPDRDVVQTPIISDASIDAYAANMADSNVVLSTYTNSYVDPSPSRMPMTKNWTISDYARIPGLRTAAYNMTSTDKTQTFDLIKVGQGDFYRIPLDYAYLSSTLWRGSLKVCLMFFTSTFISARVVVSLINSARYPSSYPDDYTSGISKVINVKGDTIDTMTLPWLEPVMWTTLLTHQIKVSLDSEIACVDTVTSPKIWYTLWVSGGEDIQFAYPRVPLQSEWSSTPSSVPQARKRLSFQAQCSVGGLFEKPFAPIIENVVADIDRGYATAEALGSITDICKRYSPLGPGTSVTLNGSILDTMPLNQTGDVSKADYVGFRASLLGSWRAAFLFRSGGYKWRCWHPEPRLWVTNSTPNMFGTQGTERLTSGTVYRTGSDGVARVTFPQLSTTPFMGLSDAGLSQLLSFNSDNIKTSSDVTTLVAARDDLQYGFPILPKLIPN